MRSDRNGQRWIRRDWKSQDESADIRAISSAGNALSPFPLGPEQFYYLRGREVFSKTSSEEV